MTEYYKHIVVSISDLNGYEHNARTHSKGQIDQVKNSIAEFGFTNPLLIDENNGVMAGHGRMEAAKSLGFKTVPCIVVTGLDEAQRKALILADNQIALNSGWDLDILKLELKSLEDLNFDLQLTGFDNDFLNELMLDAELGETEQDAIPEMPETIISVLGDVWQLGGHRLMCGSSTDANSVDLIINRWQDFTGKQALHVESGKTYEELKGERNAN